MNWIRMVGFFLIGFSIPTFFTRTMTEASIELVVGCLLITWSLRKWIKHGSAR